ncbi:hypothetical protein GCM10010145_05850 [Streptomyces ruber]|uniref:Uncharacterized protein n=2 Tax=Streptomyces TaxID=1883 RepID=A0A918B867_9ACTN|nr:hypothetical protein [Streptomyces ruber]GGQ40654.1 hypothetical protein GCM10010145_05850 [Streptomyces ruber]
MDTALTYGEVLSPAPGGVLWGLFCTTAALGLTATVWPRTRWTYARFGAALLQWAALSALTLLLVSGGA